jgi:hypothetical protein
MACRSRLIGSRRPRIEPRFGKSHRCGGLVRPATGKPASCQQTNGEVAIPTKDRLIVMVPPLLTQAFAGRDPFDQLWSNARHRARRSSRRCGQDAAQSQCCRRLRRYQRPPSPDQYARVPGRLRTTVGIPIASNPWRMMRVAASRHTGVRQYASRITGHASHSPAAPATSL